MKKPFVSVKCHCYLQPICLIYTIILNSISVNSYPTMFRLPTILKCILSTPSLKLLIKMLKNTKLMIKHSEIHLIFLSSLIDTIYDFQASHIPIHVVESILLLIQILVKLVSL